MLSTFAIVQVQLRQTAICVPLQGPTQAVLEETNFQEMQGEQLEVGEFISIYWPNEDRLEYTPLHKVREFANLPLTREKNSANERTFQTAERLSNTLDLQICFCKAANERRND